MQYVETMHTVAVESVYGIGHYIYIYYTCIISCMCYYNA